VGSDFINAIALTPGLVAQLARFAPTAVGRDGRGTQMVTQQVIQRAALAHRHALTGRIVVLDHRAGAAGPFKVIAYVGGGAAAKSRLDPPPIPIVHKAGAGRAAHARQPVLGVVSQVVGAAAHFARNLVAVGVVSILLHPGFASAKS
jgi:hypothetical protein